MLAFVHLVACGEALMLAKRAGLDLAQAYEVIRGELGNELRPRDRGPGDPRGQLRHRLHARPRLKDLGLALALGRETGVPLELAELTEQAFARARDATAARPGRRWW